MAKNVFEHTDKIGQTLAIDDCVVYPVKNSLTIGKVVTINEKMCRVKSFDVAFRRWGPDKGDLKYPSDMCKIDSEFATMYILKNLTAGG